MSPLVLFILCFKKSIFALLFFFFTKLNKYLFRLYVIYSFSPALIFDIRASIFHNLFLFSEVFLTVKRIPIEYL